MAKFDPDHAVVPPTNFGYKNSAEKFLECGKFRKCANLRLIPAQLQIVRLHIPVCVESRFNRTGTAEWLPMPVFGQPLSPLTYTTVGEWAPHISCPVKCEGYRSPRWSKIRSWFRPKRTEKEAPTMSGVLSNGWVQTFGGAFVLSIAALIVEFKTGTGVPVAEVGVVSTLVPTLASAAIVWYRTRTASEPSRDERTKFPERGDYSHSTTSTRKNPDGSITFEGTASGQIDRRPQLWEAVSNKFGNLPDKPIPIRGEWVYTFETKHYDWTVRYQSAVTVALCIEICKEAGRL